MVDVQRPIQNAKTPGGIALRQDVAGGLEHKQIVAMVKAVELGGRLQKECGQEILLQYRDGASIRMISLGLGIPARYNVTEKIGMNSVYYALHGYKGRLEVDTYGGLADAEELKRLKHDHWIKLGSIMGKISATSGRGIHALTPERLDAERSRGGINAAIARGRALWTNPEKQELLRMSELPENRHPSGKVKGRVNLGKVIKQINELYHGREPVRSRAAVNDMLSSLRKQKINES